MKDLKDILNEGSSFVNTKKAETLKNIQTIFNNIKDPKKPWNLFMILLKHFKQL